MADHKAIAARLRSLAQGHHEWRVQSITSGSYCIAWDCREYTNPERDALGWLAGVKKMYPGKFEHHEVANVHVLTDLERAALEAADALDPPAAGGAHG